MVFRYLDEHIDETYEHLYQHLYEDLLDEHSFMKIIWINIHITITNNYLYETLYALDEHFHEYSLI